jgi:NADH dehydrogenase
VPGIAPAAIQMGKYVAGIITKECESQEKSPCEAASGNRPRRKPFHFVDKGMLATIGRAKAVGTIFGVHVSGLIAWLAWAGIHIFFLIGFRNRLIVLLRWAWAYFIFQRGARLITGAVEINVKKVLSEAREQPRVSAPAAGERSEKQAAQARH